ncbi:MAG: glycoside hydrolase family 92 protein, partial [Deltaproteobacteria bacterium]|nr:glycoside hydrolase family 92 protein [Deltaproteobacteria bacterium]
MLTAILVEGGTAEHRRAFYSGLYRSFLMPTVTSDVDGQFRFADTLGRVEPGQRFFSDMSLWDTYRTVHPLYDLIAPDSAADSVRSLLLMNELGGG